MFTFMRYFVPNEDSMLIEVGISHDLIQEYNGVITVETTVHFVEAEENSADSMNLIH